MPYITKDIRQALDPDHGRRPTDSAELSFALTQQIKRFMDVVPNGGFEGFISKVYGALDAAKLAFEQEVVVPYEAKKREQNGKIF